METVQKSSESLSRSSGGAIGAGAVILPQILQQPQGQAQTMVLCPKCGFQNPQTAKFCNSCAAPLQAAGTINCPKCNASNPANAKFCVECGATLKATKKCPKCNADVPTGNKFCPECGAKVS